MNKKKATKDKKQTVSVRIPNELLVHLDGVDNKSKFFEWLLVEYFDNIDNGK